jgi:CRP/FNR family transcriptional regulator
VADPGLELDDIDFLSLLREGTRRRLLEGSTKVKCPAGDVAYGPESPPRVFLIESGLMRAYYSVADGRQATAAFLHSRELVGGTWIVSHPPRVLVQSVVKCSLTNLDLSAVVRLAAAENEVMAAVAESLAARLRRAYMLVAVRSLGDIRQRLAYDLLDRACQSQLKQGRLEATVTQTDLANSIGSAREVVGRNLNRMREEGLIETVPGLVRVLDPLRLAGIVRAFTL